MNDSDKDVIQKPGTEEPEGLDSSETSGWGDEYPLDSIFVRREQRTVSEVVKRIKANRYILNPEFQRSFVWSIKKQSRLIESCLMRIPLPVFYVAEAKDGRIIVVDGLQRLTTFIRYLDGEFALSKLGEGREDAPQENPLLGRRFSDLALNLQERLLDTQLILYILDAKAPDRAKLDIFERVNSGEPLARQQMRNCLFSGRATKWLKDMAENPPFLIATGESLDKKSMRDREAINRFCAFRLLGVEQYRGDMDDFLARVLEKMNTLSKQEMEDLALVFERSMWANFQFFGRHAFRKSLAMNNQHASRTVLNIALFDTCSVLFADLGENVIKEREEPLKNAITNLLGNEDFIQAITYATNARRQVKIRFEMMAKAIAEAI